MNNNLTEITSLLLSEIKEVLQNPRHNIACQVNEELLVEFNRHCLANQKAKHCLAFWNIHQVQKIVVY
jgi:hypothetical protein